MKAHHISFVILVCVVLLDIVVCPYNKVEESFNIQACHDILYYGPDLGKYDHTQFPGVVPRTFIGPLMLAALSWPVKILFDWTDVSKLFMQYIVRSLLALLVLHALKRWQSSLHKTFKNSLNFNSFTVWYFLIIASQFHFNFYISRTLPNIFALIFVLHSLASLNRNQHGFFVFWGAVAVVIFRGEVALLFAPITLFELIRKRLSLGLFIAAGISSLALTLSSTILIDSYFWGRWLWPEGEVLYFNVILNKSSDWGTSPWAWYFYSALPRALGLSLLLVPLGFQRAKDAQKYIISGFLFILAFSFLPHKELRFIIYALPLLNVSAAVVVESFSRGSKIWQKICFFGLVGHILCNAAINIGMLTVSSMNYPGGNALEKLHTIEEIPNAIAVHLDNLACQTGVTRFGQIHNSWTYDKTENISYEDKTRYDILIEEIKPELQKSKLLESFVIIDTTEKFTGLSVQSKWPPVIFKQEPVLYTLKKLR